MDPGLLQHRVELLEPQDARAANGELLRIWVRYAYAWALIQPLRGTEAMLAQQVQGRMQHRITVRYDNRIKAEHRIRYGTRNFEINEIRNIDERDVYCELMCTEVVE